MASFRHISVCFRPLPGCFCQLSSCFRPLLKINFAELKIISIFAVQYRGVEQLVARRAHNPEVGGSSPPPATKTKRPFRPLFLFYHPYIVIRTISRGVPGLTLFLHATVPFCSLDANFPGERISGERNPRWRNGWKRSECGMWNGRGSGIRMENRNLSCHFSPHSHLASFVMIDNQ